MRIVDNGRLHLRERTQLAAIRLSVHSLGRILGCGAAVLVRIHYSFFWLLSLYYGQLSIYGYVGQILLGAVEEDF